jgi:hypothetical protein
VRQRLFNFAAALSLLGCLAMLWLWDVSYTTGYYFDWRTHDRDVYLLGSTGRIFFSPSQVRRHDQYSFKGFLYGRMSPLSHWDQMLPSHHLYLQSFAAGWNDNGTFAGYCLILPYWFFAVLASVIPGIWLRRRLNRRPPKGHCQACGYNLTGNTSGACPECGTPRQVS